MCKTSISLPPVAEMICKVLIQLAAKKGLSQTLQSGLEVYRGLVQAHEVDVNFT